MGGMRVARLIKCDMHEPYKVDVEGAEKPVWICGCGLSARKPFCDGAHKTTRDEETGVTYVYDGQNRVKV